VTGDTSGSRRLTDSGQCSHGDGYGRSDPEFFPLNETESEVDNPLRMCRVGDAPSADRWLAGDPWIRLMVDPEVFKNVG